MKECVEYSHEGIYTGSVCPWMTRSPLLEQAEAPHMRHTLCGIFLHHTRHCFKALLQGTASRHDMSGQLSSGKPVLVMKMCQGGCPRRQCCTTGQCSAQVTSHTSLYPCVYASICPLQCWIADEFHGAEYTFTSLTFPYL